MSAHRSLSAGPSVWPVLVAAVLSSLWLTGCDSAAPEARYRRSDFEHLAPTDALSAALAEGWRTLAEPDDPVRKNPDLATYCRLISRVKNPATRDSAQAEMAGLWRADPANPLWHELAAARFKSLHRTLADSLYAAASLTDPTRARGCFARAMLARDKDECAARLTAAAALQAELSSFEQAWFHYQLLFRRDSRGPAPAAIEKWVAFLARARRSGGPLLEMLAWYRLGRLSERCDRPVDALQAYFLADNLAQRHGATYHLCICQNRATRILIDLDETRPTLPMLADGITNAERNGYSNFVPGMKTDLASLHAKLGDTNQALALIRQVVDQAVAEDDSVWAVRSMVNMATYYQVTSELDSCRMYHDRALTWSRCFDDPLDRVRLAFYRSEYFLHLGDYAVVDSLLAAAAAELATADPDPSNLRAELLVKTIRLARLSGRPAAAYAAIDELRRLKADITDTSADYSLVGDTERTIAEFLGWQGEHALARQALAAARRSVATHGGEYDVWFLEKTAFELAMWSEDLPAAEIAAQRCLDIAQRREDTDLTTVSRSLLGRLYLAQDALADAVRMFTIARDETYDRHEFRTVLSSLIFKGIAQSRQQQNAAALKSFQAAVAFHRQDPPADLQARLLLETARVARAAGDAAGARRSLQDALANLDSTRDHPDIDALRIFYTDLVREITEELIELHLTRPDPDAAESPELATLRLAEACRGSGSDLRLNVVRGANRGADHEPGSPTLAFFVGRSRSFRWILSSTGLTVDRLPGRNELKHRLSAVLADFGSPRSEIDRPALQKLSRLLLGPVQNVWHPDHVLRVASDDLLAAVPWYGLVLDQPDGSSLSLVEYGEVIETIQIADRSGEEERRWAEKGEPANTGPDELLAVGVNSRRDPGAASDTQLRFAELEAREVAEIWAPDPMTLAVGADASWSRLRQLDLARFTTIHLATHTTIYQGQSGQSVIRLGLGEDAVPLSMTEIETLELQADLVFISCCEAARRVTRSGATANFAQAFLAAGAKSVIAPAVRIEDEAARDLARRFYGHWRGGKPKSAALRQALRDTRRARTEWHHPHYWAFYRLLE